ncbi:hypothetical protein, partial [Inquilinus sp.]|uniref:hypothetical protein n=1 Tax=Inquilinus sp. TaxID=1932117 RepID=UPI0031D8CD99
MSQGLKTAAAGLIATLVLMVLPAKAAQIQSATVNGVAVDRVTWRGSDGGLRTVSLKRQGNGNPGNGGYAV